MGMRGGAIVENHVQTALETAFSVDKPANLVALMVLFRTMGDSLHIILSDRGSGPREATMKYTDL